MRLCRPLGRRRPGGAALCSAAQNSAGAPGTSRRPPSAHMPGGREHGRPWHTPSEHLCIGLRSLQNGRRVEPTFGGWGRRPGLGARIPVAGGSAVIRAAHVYRSPLLEQKRQQECLAGLSEGRRLLVVFACWSSKPWRRLVGAVALQAGTIIVARRVLFLFPSVCFVPCSDQRLAGMSTLSMGHTAAVTTPCGGRQQWQQVSGRRRAAPGRPRQAGCPAASRQQHASSLAPAPCPIPRCRTRPPLAPPLRSRPRQTRSPSRPCAGQRQAGVCGRRARATTTGMRPGKPRGSRMRSSCASGGEGSGAGCSRLGDCEGLAAEGGDALGGGQLLGRGVQPVRRHVLDEG
jgi:hypothetical protein